MQPTSSYLNSLDKKGLVKGYWETSEFLSFWEIFHKGKGRERSARFDGVMIYKRMIDNFTNLKVSMAYSLTNMTDYFVCLVLSEKKFKSNMLSIPLPSFKPGVIIEGCIGGGLCTCARVNKSSCTVHSKANILCTAYGRPLCTMHVQKTCPCTMHER